MSRIGWQKGWRVSPITSASAGQVRWAQTALSVKPSWSKWHGCLTKRHWQWKGPCSSLEDDHVGSEEGRNLGLGERRSSTHSLRRAGRPPASDPECWRLGLGEWGCQPASCPENSWALGSCWVSESPLGVIVIECNLRFNQGGLLRTMLKSAPGECWNTYEWDAAPIFWEMRIIKSRNYNTCWMIY